MTGAAVLAGAVGELITYNIYLAYGLLLRVVLVGAGISPVFSSNLRLSIALTNI